MASQHESAILKSIQTLFKTGTTAGLSDGQLLERIGSGPAAMTEVAFEALLRKHGGMVWNVCRHVLRDVNDAEDAFQASFLVLLRKAGSIRKRNALGPWLYGVAYRIAVRAKKRAARRRLHENQGAARLAVAASPDSSLEELALLHEEVTRLPEKYRMPVILCYLEGRTNDDVARQLGWPVGTVSGRLARAKSLLRARLTQRGLAPSAALFGVTLKGELARAMVPERLIEKTVSAFLGNPMQGPVAGAAVANSVKSLAHGTLHTLSLTQSKWIAASLLASVTVATGAAMEWQDVKALRAETGHLQVQSKKQAQDAGSDPIGKVSKSAPGEAANESALMELAQEELAVIEARYKAKEAELRKAEAQLELASTVLDVSRQLVKAAQVSKLTFLNNESGVKVASAQRDVVRSELEECKVRLDQAKRIINHPELVGPWLEHAGRSSSFSALENRLKSVERQLDRLPNVEQKLDQILKMMAKPSEKR
jgi:RNA polymerase sigma factor (sigma-70 family)